MQKITWYKVRDKAGAIYLALFCIGAAVTPFVLVGQSVGAEKLGWSVSARLILVGVALYAAALMVLAWGEDKELRVEEIGFLKVAFSSVFLIASLVLAIIS